MSASIEIFPDDNAPETTIVLVDGPLKYVTHEGDTRSMNLNTANYSATSIPFSEARSKYPSSKKIIIKGTTERFSTNMGQIKSPNPVMSFEYTYNKLPSSSGNQCGETEHFRCEKIEHKINGKLEGFQHNVQRDIDFQGKNRKIVDTVLNYEDGKLKHETIWYDGIKTRKEFDASKQLHRLLSHVDENGNTDLKYYDHGVLDEGKTKKAENLLKNIQRRDNALKILGVSGHKDNYPALRSDKQIIHIRNKLVPFS